MHNFFQITLINSVSNFLHQIQKSHILKFWEHCVEHNWTTAKSLCRLFYIYRSRYVEIHDLDRARCLSRTSFVDRHILLSYEYWIIISWTQSKYITSRLCLLLLLVVIAAHVRATPETLIALITLIWRIIAVVKIKFMLIELHWRDVALNASVDDTASFMGFAVFDDCLLWLICWRQLSHASARTVFVFVIFKNKWWWLLVFIWSSWLSLRELLKDLPAYLVVGRLYVLRLTMINLNRLLFYCYHRYIINDRCLI